MWLNITKTIDLTPRIQLQHRWRYHVEACDLEYVASVTLVRSRKNALSWSEYPTDMVPTQLDTDDALEDARSLARAAVADDEDYYRYL